MKLVALECGEDVLSVCVEYVCLFGIFIVAGEVGARILVVVVFFLDLVAVWEVIGFLVDCFIDVLVELLALLLLLVPPFAFLLARLSALCQALSPE